MAIDRRSLLKMAAVSTLGAGALGSASPVTPAGGVGNCTDGDELVWPVENVNCPDDEETFTVTTDQFGKPHTKKEEVNDWYVRPLPFAAALNDGVHAPPSPDHFGHTQFVTAGIYKGTRSFEIPGAHPGMECRPLWDLLIMGRAGTATDEDGKTGEDLLESLSMTIERGVNGTLEIHMNARPLEVWTTESTTSVRETLMNYGSSDDIRRDDLVDVVKRRADIAPEKADYLVTAASALLTLAGDWTGGTMATPLVAAGSLLSNFPTNPDWAAKSGDTYRVDVASSKLDKEWNDWVVMRYPDLELSPLDERDYCPHGGMRGIDVSFGLSTTDVASDYVHDTHTSMKLRWRGDQPINLKGHMTDQVTIGSSEQWGDQDQRR